MTHTHEQPIVTRRHAQIGVNRIAYLDEGDGPPVLLLHGSSFSSFVWRRAKARRFLAAQLDLDNQRHPTEALER